MLGFMDGFLFAIGVLTARFVWGVFGKILERLANKLDKETGAKD